MSMSVLEALRIFYDRRGWSTESAESATEQNQAWLNPAQPLTRDELEQVAEAVYALMQTELRTERERQRGF